MNKIIALFLLIFFLGIEEMGLYHMCEIGLIGAKLLEDKGLSFIYFLNSPPHQTQWLDPDR